MANDLDDVRMTINRRDFLRAGAVIPGAAALGALYYGYGRVAQPVKAGIVGTGNEGVAAMIEQSPPDYLQYVSYYDIRPSNQAKARRAFTDLYGKEMGSKVKLADSYKAMLDDPEIEAIVIATPLFTHAQLTIEALKAGKHVLCEKLMARNITDAKAMVRAQKKFSGVHGRKLFLSIGHQRHYNTLYADAVKYIKSGVLGDVHHIRALWHRNNTWLDPKGEIKDSWRPNVPEADLAAVKEGKLDPAKFGYDSVEQLVRWRLYDKTGGGLMAELGSHQLDACSIFLQALEGSESPVHPLAVTASGGKHFYDDDRDAADHVYCLFEFPNGRTVMYSSINTNAMEGYGEIVEGTRGTLLVMHERDLEVKAEFDPFSNLRNTGLSSTVGKGEKDESSMYSAGSLGLPAKSLAKSTDTDISRGYKEELEHFAFCIRHPDSGNVRCDGQRALADAVMALTANVAMAKGERIEFDDRWYDPASPHVPDDVPKDNLWQSI